MTVHLKPEQPQRFHHRAIILVIALMHCTALVFSAAAHSTDAYYHNIEYADLADIRFHRKLRILIPKIEDPNMLRVQVEFKKLLQKFNDEQFLIPQWIPVERRQDLIPQLLAGHGDLIAAPLSINEYRLRGAGHSTAIRQLREALIVRRNDSIYSLDDLSNRRLAIRERSGFWQQLHRLRERLPTVQVQTIPQHMPLADVLANIRDMRFDVALVDTATLADVDQQWPQLRILNKVGSSTSLAFGLHPQAVELKSTLDDFLSREQFVKQSQIKSRKDLQAMKSRGVLRVLTHNNSTDYFIWRGQPLGFEYRLLAKFADELGMSLKIIVPESEDQFIPALLAGEADVVAASMAIKPHVKLPGVAFSRPYRQHHGVIVGQSQDTDIQSAQDLAGRTLTVRRNSSDWQALSRYKDQGVDLKLLAASPTLDSEELIERVVNGIFDLAVINVHKLNAALERRKDVRALYTMPEPDDIGWAVRADNPQLIEALNQFIEREYKGLFYNMLHNRYFEKPRPTRLLKAQRNNVLNGLRISPFDDIVRHEAAKYGFDWPLIVALMYRESRFNPEVESWAGAKGLMQVLPVTAKRFGINNLQNPKNSITAGIRMLDWLYRRLDDSLPVQERIWFSLAAYNAGLGHLLDARILARELKLDPELWFGNVEQAMRLLSKPKYYHKAKHGYVRGIEPVTYVRDIRDLYNIYRSFPRE